MYEFLSGSVVGISPTRVVLEIGGVGWDLACSVNTTRRLDRGERVRLFTHLVVREDLLALYGFHSQQERDLFRALISVSGVGPKVALAILSGLEAQDLLAVIEQGEILRLTSVPGVGRKTAERLVLELRDRLASRLPATVAGGGDAAAAGASTETGRITEAREALLALGFKPAQAESELKKALQLAAGSEELPEVEDLVRQVLRSGK